MSKKIFIFISIMCISLIIAIFICFSYRKTFIVNFNSNGGSKIESIRVKKGEKVNRPSDPFKEGYEFVGWFNLDEEYDFNEKVNGNLTLQAKWIQQEYDN